MANLLENVAWSAGYVGNDGGLANTSSTTDLTSDYIPVVSGSDYSLTCTSGATVSTRLAEYTAAKILISRDTSGSVSDFTTSGKTAYVRVTIMVENASTIAPHMVLDGEAGTEQEVVQKVVYEWVNGYVDGSGNVASNSTALTSEFVKVNPGETYSVIIDSTTFTTLRYAEYGANKEFVQRTTSGYPSTFTASDKAEYIRLTVMGATGATVGLASTTYLVNSNGIQVPAEGITEEPDEPEVVYYTITNTLSHVMNSNTSVQIEEGGAYDATLTADSGYILNSVAVTMGDTDVTASAYSGNSIAISSVTGDLVITAIAIVSDSGNEDDGNEDSGADEMACYTWSYGYVNAEGKLVASSNTFTCELIKIEPDTTYTVDIPDGCTMCRYAEYSSAQALLARYTNGVISEFTTSAAAAYVRISVAAPNLTVETVKAVVLRTSDGTIVKPTAIFDGKYVLPWLVNRKYNMYNAQKFIGKKYYSLGDSITALGTGGDRIGYQQYVVEQYGVLHTNYGTGGATVASKLADYKALNFADVSLVTIGFGVNDCRTNLPLGEIGLYAETEHDESTFYGAYRVLLDKIYGDNPECRVVLITPLQRGLVNGLGCDNTNENGASLLDFVDAVKSLGEMYSAPVLDVFRESGINQVNIAHYTYDGVHPTNAGYFNIANLLIETIDKF